MGNPTNPDDIEALKKAKEIEERGKPPEWQDPEFLKDIQVGISMLCILLLCIYITCNNF
jgi:hypothetical protein